MATCIHWSRVFRGVPDHGNALQEWIYNSRPLARFTGFTVAELAMDDGEKPGVQKDNNYPRMTME